MMRMTSLLRGRPQTALLAVSLALASTTQAKAEDIIVGAATSFSGWMAAFDTNPTRAAQLAVDEINAKVACSATN